MKHYKKLFSFGQKEIDAAFKKARPLGSINGIKLLSAPAQADAEHGKLLIITSRRTGKAHDRNKIRRQIKAIYYEEKLYETKNVVIALVYKNALERSFDEIKQFLVKSIGTK